MTLIVVLIIFFLGLFFFNILMGDKQIIEHLTNNCDEEHKHIFKTYAKTDNKLKLLKKINNNIAGIEQNVNNNLMNYNINLTNAKNL